ncbi:MAG TPA: tetratricopeptide repeat protein, partial [Vicinamibacteria bacterium]|nr:tetratricopeptide repeat protein [Vicinamibacteria bacterium]
MLRSLVGSLIAAALCAGAGRAAEPPSDELAAKARRGKEAMAAGRFTEAAGLYAEIVRALPGEPGMLLNLGMALALSGRAQEAVPHLQAALKLRPDLLPASLFLGSAYMELGQPARAVDPLQTVVAAQPDNHDARQMLADALLSLERYEPAAQHFRKLSEAAPQDPRAWYGLGRSYEGLAERPFVELQHTAPDSPYLLLLVAHAMEAQGKVANAFRLYREALDKRPDFAEAHEGVARIYEQKGQPAWAATERAKAKAIPPPDCRSPTLECDFKAGRYPAVWAAAKPAAGSEQGKYWLSRAADEMAREAFVRVGQLPPSPEALLVKVQVLRGQRQPPGELILEMKKAVSTWPDDLRLRR